jgi:beta-lactamase class A
MALSKNLGRGYKKPKRWFRLLIPLGLLVLGFFGYNLYANREVSSGDENRNFNPIEIIKKDPEPIIKKDPTQLKVGIESYLGQQVGTYGYHIIELDEGGRSFGARDDAYYTAASTVKVAVFAYLYNQIESGKINPDTVWAYTGADYETGTGSLQNDTVGTRYKVSFLAERMIVASDNVATNILMRNLGRTNIQNYLNNNSLTEINLVANDVTPRGMAKLLQLIHQGKLISSTNKDLLFEYMKDSITPTRLVAGVPAEIEVAHKIGSWSGAISDIGIVFGPKRDYAIAVFSEGVAWGEETDAVIAGISKRVYEFEKSF